MDSSMESVKNSSISTPEYVDFRAYKGKHKGIWAWLLTTDHKRIGITYMYGMLGFFAVGVIIGFLMRLENYSAAIDLGANDASLSLIGVRS